MSELGDLRWYADRVERVQFSSGPKDNPNYRLQQFKVVDGCPKWSDVPAFVENDAKIVDIDLRSSI